MQELPLENSRRKFLTSTSASILFPFLMTTTSLNAAEIDNKYGILGAQAPEIELDYWIDAYGEKSEFSIHSQKGKWTYLYCFQDWCPGCHAHGFPALQKLSTELNGNSNLSIVSVQTVFEGFSSNTLEDVRKLQKQYDLAIPMGHDAGDPNGDHRPSVMKNYRTGGTPWTVIIDPNGTVAFNDYHINIDNFIDFIKKQPA
jgi:thiol-disulfide isomerase/thioredoxin